MKRKVEDYNLDPSVKPILSSKCTRYDYVMKFNAFVSEDLDQNKKSSENNKRRKRLFQ